jgi:hypothetical protein
MTITDLIYLTAAIVDEEFLSETELIWEAMWAFAYLCILASLFWYYRLVHLLSENSAEYYCRLLEMSNYAANYRNNISEDEGSEKDQLHTENKQDFKLVENRIDEIIKGARSEITILFCNINTLNRKESQSILIFLRKKTRPNILVRILFPFGVDDTVIDSYSEVADENNDIIIVRDDIEVLLVSTADPIDYDKETAYFVESVGLWFSVG